MAPSHSDGERSPEEIAEEHDHLIEFGRAIHQLRKAADTLERNGHWTAGATELLESAQENLNTVAAEEMEVAEAQREYIGTRVEQGATVEEALEEWNDGERIPPGEAE